MSVSLIPLLVAVAGTALAGAIDARTGRIPDAISRTTALVAALAASIVGLLDGALLGAVVVGGSLLTLYLATAGRGLGLGDVKLATAIGMGCGPAIGTLALGSSFVLGAAFAVALLVTRRVRRSDALPFGPFLAAGTAVAAIPALLV